MARRREELGVTRETIESRAGIAPGYLEYLERAPDANVATETLARLAAALDTTPAALRGGDVDLPPGDQSPAAHPILTTISDKDCMRLLGERGIGRFVFRSRRGPVALPVNYVIVDGDVVFRTAVDGEIGSAVPDAPVSFEVDHIDDGLREGWSVLLTGRVQRIADPERYRQLDAIAPQPWAGGDRPLMLRLVPTERSGRRIVAL